MSELPPTRSPRPRAARAGELSYTVFALARAHRARAAQLLRGMGLHPGQEHLIMQLLDRDGQTQQELLESVGLDQSTVSKSLRRMEEAGLLTREPAPHDRRVRLVTLTDRGRALRGPLEAMWAQLEASSVAGLEDDDVVRFIAIASRIERGMADTWDPAGSTARD